MTEASRSMFDLTRKNKRKIYFKNKCVLVKLINDNVNTSLPNFDRKLIPLNCFKGDWFFKNINFALIHKIGLDSAIAINQF